MKINKMILILLFSATASVFAQKNKTGKKDLIQSSAMENRNWQGTYFGITDCANCDGIETRLVLKKGNKFTISTRATHTNQKEYKQEGTFTWRGNIIVLQGILVNEMASRYLVQENQVKQLYLIDNELQGQDWNGYTLKKINVAAKDKP